MMNYSNILSLLPGFIIGLTIHEFSHAYVATRLGDPTARAMGRLTLNPLAHLDLFGSLMLIFAGFGWAKPVPVNAGYLHSPRRDMAMIAFAGPVSNVLLALLVGFGLRAAYPDGYLAAQSASPVTAMTIWIAVQAVWINVILAAFNMIPIPPLDGSRILAGIVPEHWNHGYEQFERIGPMLLLGLVLLANFGGVSIFNRLVSPIAKPLLAFILGSWLTI
jgi:Zn-dependent protease